MNVLVSALRDAAKEMGSDPTSFAASARVKRVWDVLATVNDPEIPVISVLDLGIVRAVVETDIGVDVHVTPTYAGCPAVEVIEQDIVAALHAAGIPARAVTTLTPAWSTDWITQQGRAKLKQYGIAPPGPVSASDGQVIHFKLNGVRPHLIAEPPEPPSCPLCDSPHTERLSQFGSTACKALYRCVDCREPFDYFKPL